MERLWPLPFSCPGAITLPRRCLPRPLLFQTAAADNGHVPGEKLDQSVYIRAMLAWKSTLESQLEAEEWWRMAGSLEKLLDPYHKRCLLGFCPVWRWGLLMAGAPYFFQGMICLVFPPIFGGTLLPIQTSGSVGSTKSFFLLLLNCDTIYDTT